jgi:hypothetical protein
MLVGNWVSCTRRVLRRRFGAASSRLSMRSGLRSGRALLDSSTRLFMRMHGLLIILRMGVIRAVGAKASLLLPGGIQLRVWGLPVSRSSWVFISTCRDVDRIVEDGEDEMLRQHILANYYYFNDPIKFPPCSQKVMAWTTIIKGSRGRRSQALAFSSGLISHPIPSLCNKKMLRRPPSKFLSNGMCPSHVALLFRCLQLNPLLQLTHCTFMASLCMEANTVFLHTNESLTCSGRNGIRFTIPILKIQRPNLLPLNPSYPTHSPKTRSSSEYQAPIQSHYSRPKSSAYLSYTGSPCLSSKYGRLAV